MNRRDFFKGLAAFCATAAIPLPLAVLEAVPEPELISHLQRLRLDILNLIVHPPYVMDPATQAFHVMDTGLYTDTLRYLDELIKSL